MEQPALFLKLIKMRTQDDATYDENTTHLPFIIHRYIMGSIVLYLNVEPDFRKE